MATEYSSSGYILLLLLISLPCSIAQSMDSDGTDGERYNPPAATIVIVLIGVLFVLTGFLSVYLRHYAASCFGVETGGGNAADGYRSTQRGLDPAIVQSFPVYLYSDVKLLRSSTLALECAVCLNEYEGHEILRLLPGCSHVFHPHCVDSWLVTRGTCPVCRANLEKVTSSFDIPSAHPTLQETGPAETPNDINHNNQPHVVGDLDHHIVDVNQYRSPVMIRGSRSLTPEIATNNITPIRPGVLGLKDKIIGRFPRSHSTGHSLFRSGDDWDRFTLKLPDDIRNKLVNLNLLNTGNSPAAHPLSALNSPKSGFRSTTRDTYYEKWGFTMTPPFISRARSPSPVVMSDGEGSIRKAAEQQPTGTTGGGFLKSLSPLLDKVVRGPGTSRDGGTGGGDVGERSSDCLRPPNQSSNSS